MSRRRRLGLLAVLVATGGLAAADVHHDAERPACEACHAASDAAPVIGAGCVSCHEDGVPPAGAEGDGASADEPALAMARPLLEEGSRLGDRPSEMVRIPAGGFIMGTDERFSDEGPAHRVSLGAYEIDRYPVTNLQYEAFVRVTHRRSPAHFAGGRAPAGRADHPVVHVSWFDARDYCDWAAKRLPTEAEWEKAARGTDGRSFPWGEHFDISRANTPLRWEALGQPGGTTPVGAFPGGVSPWGLHDVTGNVWEWTNSWYLPYPGNDEPSENYGRVYRVLRGGSWWDCSFYQCGISAPVYNRAFFSARVRNDTFGFRCARDIDQPPASGGRPGP